MLDIKLLRDNTEEVLDGLGKRREEGFRQEIEEILAIDRQRRDLLPKLDEMKAQRNAVSKQIPQIKKAGGDTASLLEEMRLLADEIKEGDEKRSFLEQALQDVMLQLPNLPDADVFAGGKESNETIRVCGEKREFSFPFRNHIDLSEQLGLIDYKRGVKLGGNGSWLYTGDGARLEWALLNYFIEEHRKDGYTFLLPPHMLGWDCGTVAGQFPKFADDVFQIGNPSGDEKKFMLPTAETALVNLHRDEMIPEEALPLKYFAYTPCYRREAGSYRSEERGMIRGHQFNKVEMVQYATEEGSDAAFAELVGKAESLVSKLGLHFRVCKLAAADVSASMARTYDIEIFIPSMGIYKEVSSASNARDFQARRGNIRYRGADGKLRFAHTLNASGLATSRIFPALLEQNQQEDGSVLIPEVLRPYMGMQERLTPVR